MATLRIPSQLHERVRAHLLDHSVERFAFLFARISATAQGPVFVVHDALLVPEDQVVMGRDGFELSTDALLEAINTAVRRGHALVECHSHGGDHPRFSRTDRRGLEEVVPYALSSLAGRPYGATVWGDDRVHGEWFDALGGSGDIDSIMVVGERLEQLAPLPFDLPVEVRHDRQRAWFAPARQYDLARLRVAVPGCGGTGSQLVQQLVYLGCRRFLLIDPDVVDESNLNRVVSAGARDIGVPKVELAARLIRTVAPDAEIEVLRCELQSEEALSALKSADVIFGCVDNDGARLVLNELALAYLVPYLDLAVGISVDGGTVVEAGGRVAIMSGEGPCLNCLGEIDRREAAYFLASPQERAVARERGYVEGLDVHAPAVVSLNGAIVAAAVNELAVWISGLRRPQAITELDLIGAGRALAGQWLLPRRDAETDPSCVQCALRGLADGAGIDRYVRANREAETAAQ